LNWIFIHGAGCTGAVFAAQTAALGGVAIDLPGHAAPGAPSSIRECSDAVFAELDARGLHDVILCGSSMGGAIAIECALRHDPRVRGIALLGSGAKLRVAPSIIQGIERDFENTARTAASYFFSEATPERVDAVVAMMRAVGAEQTARDYRACDAFDRTGDLEKIDVPVVAITGEHDVMTPPKFAHFIAERVPHGSVTIVPDAGHLVMIEQPGRTNDALRAFAAGIRP
jgi:pimeloyl-ACP methyl ester carboxylesterase